MPTNKQRREAARRRLERQLQRRQQRDAARRRYTLIGSVLGSVAVVGVVVGFLVATSNDDKNAKAAASASATPTATASPSPSPFTTVTAENKTTGACGYTETTTANPDLKNVGLPPDPAKTPTVNRVVTFDSNRGVIKMTMIGKDAPCNVQSIAYLVGKKFYNATSCHRLVTSGIFVLQCGDPTGTGAGGPTYTTNDENLSKADYGLGVVAMANAGADTNGSQFFIMTKDSNAGLGKNYTVIGTITQGMNIIEAVAKGGSNNSNGAGDGKPKLALSFKTVTVSPPVTGKGTAVKVQVTKTVTASASPS